MMNAQHLNRIAIQGVPGAFHEIAARRYYPADGLQIVPAHTFEELVGMVEGERQAEGGIMAIENSIAGSILFNYQLLYHSRLQIVGEVFLRIKQNLLTLPGSTIEDLREVHSHPMAIAQCRQFFKQYPAIKLIETEDTALSARKVGENRWRHTGAIASDLAAEMYGLEVLADSIETNKKNFTRFLILHAQPSDLQSHQINKLSICFSLRHQVGTLHQVLGELARQEANLTKIQSVPLVGQEWQYLFFIDFVIENNRSSDEVIAAIEPLTEELRILGKYQKGQHHED
ncbi:MAG: prephenate dehydratase [Bacteroidota bacterium]